MKRHLLGGIVALYLLAVGPPGVQATSCPSGGATLNVYVYNPGTTVVPSVTISGRWNWATCAGNGTASTYSQTVTNLNPGENRKVTVGNVLTGVWTHHVTFGTQTQSQNGVVLIKSCKGGINPGAPCTVDSDCPGSPPTIPPGVCPYPTVNWTAFPNVITVNLAGDNGTNPADCLPNNPATCTLRKAILRANQVSGPTTRTLIQFAVSPGTMASGGLNVTGLAGNGYITIDGTDSNGNPWIVGDPNAAAIGAQSTFSRTVDLAGVSLFNITSPYVTIKGLDIRNTLPTPVPGTTPTPQTKNLIFYNTSAAQNGSVNAVRIDGGNTTISCPPSGCPTPVVSRDLINVDAAEVTITNVEGVAVIDKGVKAANGGFATVQDSWIHNNYRGGIQATYGGSSYGTIVANRNTVEKNGYRASDGAQVDPAANGLASNGASQFTTDGNVSRLNSQHGAIVNASSSLYAYNDYLCGNRFNGYAAAAAGTQTAFAQGVSAGYNALYGIALSGFSSADFGGGPLGSTGNSFFGENANSSCDFYNGTSNPVSATNDQWANDSPRVCGNVNTTGVQHGADVAMSLNNTATVPTNSIRGGQTFRVLGLGFNADGGNPAPSGCTTGADLTNSCCLKKDKSNTCDPNTPHTPLAGNCVEMGIGAIPVTSVTPTTIVTQVGGSGWACLGAQQTEYERVFVSKTTSQGPRTVSGPYCLN